MAASDPPNEINDLLARYVGDRSPLELEKASGVPRNSITNWTRTGTSPNVVGLYRLQRFFGIPWLEIEDALRKDAEREDELAAEHQREELRARILATLPEGASEEEQMRALRNLLRDGFARPGDQDDPERAE